VTFLLDTNVVSELRRAKVHSGVAAWLQKTNAAQFYLSSMTVFEIEHGVVELARTDAQSAGILSRWLRHHVLTAFEGRILPLDTSAAILGAAMHARRRKLDRDRLIAATAAAHGKIVVSRNVKDFAGLGVRVVDPFAG
jgi:toxin FitB